MRSPNPQFLVASLSTTLLCNFLLLYPLTAATTTTTSTIPHLVDTRTSNVPSQARSSGYQTREWKGSGLARLQYELEQPQQAQQVLLHDFESACSPADLYLSNLTTADSSPSQRKPQLQLYSTSQPLLQKPPPPLPPSPETLQLTPLRPSPPSPTYPPFLGQHHLHKRATGCGTQYHSCDGIGFPQLCCTTTAQCSIDYAGQPACCPIGAVCTGSATTGTYTNNAGVGGYTTTTTTSQGFVGYATSTSVTAAGAGVQTVTQEGVGGVQATETGNGFIQAAGTTVVIITESGAGRGKGMERGVVRMLGWVVGWVRAVGGG